MDFITRGEFNRSSKKYWSKYSFCYKQSLVLQRSPRFLLSPLVSSDILYNIQKMFHQLLRVHDHYDQVTLLVILVKSSWRARQGDKLSYNMIHLLRRRAAGISSGSSILFIIEHVIWKLKAAKSHNRVMVPSPHFQNLDSNAQKSGLPMKFWKKILLHCCYELQRSYCLSFRKELITGLYELPPYHQNQGTAASRGSGSVQFQVLGAPLLQSNCFDFLWSRHPDQGWSCLCLPA